MLANASMAIQDYFCHSENTLNILYIIHFITSFQKA